MTLSEIAVKRPVAMGVIIIAIIVLGVFGYLQLKVNLLPQIVYPVINCTITWSGASPEEVEDNMAENIEPKISTIDNLDYITSSCGDGIYTLTVYFNYATNIDAAYQDVLAKVSQAQILLPKDADAPVIIKADPSQIPIVQMMVSSDSMNLTKLRTWAQHYLQKQFTAVQGTAGVDVAGGRAREISVYVYPQKMQLENVTLETIAQKLNDENIELSAGLVTAERKEFLVRTKGRFTDIKQIQNLIISSDKQGKNVYLKDVADVTDSYQRQQIITRFNSKECVRLSVYKQQYANTIEVEEGLKRKIKELEDALPKDIKMGISYDQADYIRAANAGVRDAALIAAFLILIVVWFFLSSFRRILIVVTAMPLSILMTFFVMQLLGFSINLFSLGGLVLAITIVLDDAVVILENIARLQSMKNPNAVVDGTNEVGPALTYVTLVFMALFLPFLLVSGLVSLLFKELIVIIATAIGSSRLISLTITPMLTQLLTGTHHEDEEEMTLSKRLMDWLAKHYKRSLHFALGKKIWIILITTALFILGVFFFKSLPFEFLPLTDDGLVSVVAKTPIGTSTEETSRMATDLENAVKGLPGIENYFSTVGGRVFYAVTYESPEMESMDIQLVDRSKRNFTTDDFVRLYGSKIESELNYPGLRLNIMHRRLRGIRLTGNYDVEIQLRAPKTVDIMDLAAKAKEVQQRVKDVSGLKYVDLSMDIVKPEYDIQLNKQMIADLGLNTTRIATNIKTFVDGDIVSYYKDEGFFYNIRVLVARNNYSGKENVKDIPLLTNNGLPIYVRNAAEVDQKVGPVEIDRIDQMRIISVVGNVIGKSVGEVNNEIAKRLEGLELPPGWVLHYGGLAQDIAQQFSNMYIILALALFLAYVILTIQFESFIWPFIILLRVPLSLIGVSIALYMTHTPIGITVLIGFVILAGIEIVHGVILITFIQQLMEDGVPLRDAITKGAILRIRPILMTMSVGVLGLLPLALGIGEGTEMLKPMAIGVIGGLIFSIFLTFYFVPTVFEMVVSRSGFKSKKLLQNTPKKRAKSTTLP